MTRIRCGRHRHMIGVQAPPELLGIHTATQLARADEAIEYDHFAATHFGRKWPKTDTPVTRRHGSYWDKSGRGSNTVNM